jgi:hypothetical protein
MPRNGRSARAGARRAVGSLSGSGNGVLSSLTAVADGGVTMNSGEKMGNIRIGRAAKKRYLPCNDKVRK